MRDTELYRHLLGLEVPWTISRVELNAKEQCVDVWGVDEKAAAKGHKYLTLVSDLDRGTIEFIADDRKIDSLASYFIKFTPEQLEGIKAIAMDMWEPFEHAIHAHVPGAADKIVFDRFHIMQHVGRAVDTVRKQEHRELSAQGDDTLLRSKYLWLYAEENLPEQDKPRFEELRMANLKTGRAWSIKETLRHLWDHTERSDSEAHWKRWYFWATHSRLAPMIAAARTVRRHIGNVLTYFEHRITNAVSEGLNSKIQTSRSGPTGSGTRRTSRRRSTSTAEGSTSIRPV